MKYIAYTNNNIRKSEFHFDSLEGKSIINLVPVEKLQGNNKKSLVSDDGETISVYFWGDFNKFSDLDLLHDGVKLVCLKYNKNSGEHYYKYSIPNNPLGIDIDNIVATGIISNNKNIVTIYTIDALHEDAYKNLHFYIYSNYKGTTLDVGTNEVLYETVYDTQTFKDEVVV